MCNSLLYLLLHCQRIFLFFHIAAVRLLMFSSYMSGGVCVYVPERHKQSSATNEPSQSRGRTIFQRTTFILLSLCCIIPYIAYTLFSGERDAISFHLGKINNHFA